MQSSCVDWAARYGICALADVICLRLIVKPAHTAQLANFIRCFRAADGHKEHISQPLSELHLINGIRKCIKRGGHAGRVITVGLDVRTIFRTQRMDRKSISRLRSLAAELVRRRTRGCYCAQFRAQFITQLTMCVRACVCECYKYACKFRPLACEHFIRTHSQTKTLSLQSLKLGAPRCRARARCA